MDTATENQEESQKVSWARGAGKGCKIQRNGAQMLKAAHRNGGSKISFKRFVKTLVIAEYEPAIWWTKHKRKDPTPKTKHTKRTKHPSDENSKISGRSKATRFPVLMAANRHRHQ